MQEDSKITRLREFRRWGTTLVHWRGTVLTNGLFGIPLMVTMSVFLGFTRLTILRLVVFQIANVIFIWLGVWFFMGRFFSRPARKLVGRLLDGESVEESEIVETVEFLLEAPYYVALRVMVACLAAWFLGIFLLWTGLIPGIGPWLGIATAAGISFGFVAGFVESLLNYTHMEIYLRPAIEYLVSLSPSMDLGKLRFEKVPLFWKIFVLVFFTGLALQIALLTLFLGNTAVSAPEELGGQAIILVSFVAVTSIYIFIVTTSFTRNITSPLQKLISWSRKIIGGKWEKRIHTVTGDEIGEVIAYSEKMVEDMKREHNLVSAEKNKLTAVLSGIADGVIALDDHYRVLIFNRAAGEILRWSREQALGKHIDEHLHLYQEEEPLLAEDYCSLSEGEGEQSTRSWSEIRVQIPGRKAKYINLMASAVEAEEVGRVAFILTFHDVTEQRELERMKLDFVAMAAHELRTPITSIMGYLSVLSDEAEDLDEEKMMFVRRAMTSAGRLTALMENMLSITRIEKGKMTLHLEKVNWIDFVLERIEEFKPLAQEKGLELRWEPPGEELPEVEADPLRVAEVLNNLLSNALTYTQKGEVIVRCQHREDERVIVTQVQDSGPGIPDASLPHLFEKFYRVSGPLEEGSKGTGLGLYIAKSIVNMHNGDIWVESEEGQGSTFSFSLPVTTGDS